MLTYTLERLLTQQAVIERDMSVPGPGGSTGRPDWQEHLVVPCRLWWFQSSGARSAQRTYVDPARTVPLSEGGMLLPLGTDVTEKDRIARVLHANGDVYIEGHLIIDAVLAQDDHMELNIDRAHLGA